VSVGRSGSRAPSSNVSTSCFQRSARPEGGPSATDFLLHELTAIVDRLAEDYVSSSVAVEDALPVRVLITAGVLVPYIAIYSVLGLDDVVEIIYLDAHHGESG
jgi:hypothetical protein